MDTDETGGDFRCGWFVGRGDLDENPLNAKHRTLLRVHVKNTTPHRAHLARNIFLACGSRS